MVSTSLEGQGTLGTYHRPFEWFLPGDELPIETKGDNPFPALKISATAIKDGTIQYATHTYTPNNACMNLSKTTDIGMSDAGEQEPKRFLTCILDDFCG